MRAQSFNFQVIHDTYRPKLVRYLARFVGAQEAEDLAQVVMLRVSEGLPRFRGDSHLTTWIYRIATNAALDHLRARGSKSAWQSADASGLESKLVDDEDELRTAGAPQIPSPESIAIQSEMNACIHGFIDRLPEPYRAVIVLSEIEGFTNREIADILDVSLETVKIRLHRAREKLKRDLAASCDFGRDERNEFVCDRKSTPPKAC